MSRGVLQIGVVFAHDSLKPWRNVTNHLEIYGIPQTLLPMHFLRNNRVSTKKLIHID